LRGEFPAVAAGEPELGELASREEDASERFSAYYGLWVGHLTRGEPAPTREMAELFPPLSPQEKTMGVNEGSIRRSAPANSI
jgi:hypothetical protein